jgi:hypothetical protein
MFSLRVQYMGIPLSYLAPLSLSLSLFLSLSLSLSLSLFYNVPIVRFLCSSFRES